MTIKDVKMPVKKIMFQRGVILNEVVVGAFRASGTTLNKWCEENNVGVTSAQSALIGKSGGANGLALMERLVDAAGRDVVEVAYRKRIQMHAEAIGEVA